MSFKSWSAGLKPIAADKPAIDADASPFIGPPAPQPFVGPIAPTGKPPAKP